MLAKGAGLSRPAGYAIRGWRGPGRWVLAIGLALAFLLTGAPVQADASDPVPDQIQQMDRGIHISNLSTQSVPPPSRKTGTYTARFLVGTAVRQRPGRARTVWFARTRTKWSGSSQQLMVMESRYARGRTWLKVKLPIRPNKSAGWVPRDRVRLAHTSRYIEVDTSQRRLRVFRKGRVPTSFRVVVGAPATPTPKGLFALYDRVKQRDPDGFVGPVTLPLTAHSRQLRRYDGGPGLVAFHGRGGASLKDPLGSARSHGCIRMNNARIRHLATAMMGTAVRIKR